MSPFHGERPLNEVKAGLFKGLSHPLRIRILELLADGHEHSVSELQEQTGLEASHLSQHLAVLRLHLLVVSDRRASHVYYRIAYPEVAELLNIARRLLVAIVTTDSDRLRADGGLPDSAE
ncbi:MAG TPA: metalloregulator ArsR/SmtB family transcription factor [Candidatus Limnocylindrales bacterium]|jgi:ArsR family transcriptional regulator|nr:metalloregulator ArsR/SmtB family transcription factor [Candidatus Limnocylindrales bacterium]